MELPEKINSATIQSGNPSSEYPKHLETSIRKHIRTPTFTAALNTVANTRKQSTSPSVGDWIKMGSIQTVHDDSARTKDETLPFATRIDLERNDVSQTEKNTSVSLHSCGEYKTESNNHNRQTHRRRKQKGGSQRGQRGCQRHGDGRRPGFGW